MERQGESRDGSIAASLKATYRALLARGLEAGEAANLTAFLHGLPSDGFHWTLPEIEAIVRRRIRHAARAARGLPAASRASPAARARPSTTAARAHRRARRPTHVIDPPTP